MIWDFHRKMRAALDFERATSGNRQRLIFSAVEDESMTPSLEFKTNWKQIISRLSPGREMITRQRRLSNPCTVAKTNKQKKKAKDTQSCLDFAAMGVMPDKVRVQQPGLDSGGWLMFSSNESVRKTVWPKMSRITRRDLHRFTALHQSVWGLLKKDPEESGGGARRRGPPGHWLPHLQAHKASESLTALCLLKKAHR